MPALQKDAHYITRRWSSQKLFRPFSFLPQRFQVCDRNIVKTAVLFAQFLLDKVESFSELSITKLQRCFRLNVQASRDVRDHEKQIADFFTHLGVIFFAVS